MQIQLTNRELHELCMPVIPFASDDWSLPVLQSVLIQRAGDYLVASATDRYHLASRRVKPSHKMPLEGHLSFVVKVPQLLQALILFKPGRKSMLQQPLLTMTTTDTEVLFEAIPGNIEPTQHVANFITIGCGLMDASYPEVYSLLDKAVKQTREAKTSPRRVAFSMDFLADFHKAARWIDGWGHNQLVMTFGETQGQMVVCQIGPDFIGVQMPQDYARRNGDYSHEIQEALDNWVGKIPELNAGLIARNGRLAGTTRKELG